MRVLLININRERHPVPPVPLGLCCVASDLEARGFDVRVLDLCFAKDVQKILREGITRIDPEVIGISIRNLDNTNWLAPKFYLEEAKAIIHLCKSLTKAPIILGGPAFSLMPKEILYYLDCSYGLVGDGEVSMAALLGKIGVGQDRKSGLEVAFQEVGRVFYNPSWKIMDLDSFPPPKVSQWIDCNRYARYNSPMPIQTKRGCPFECIYCTYPSIEGKTYRLKSPRLVADEIEEMVKTSGIRSFEFVDSVFNAPEAHAKEVCEEIIRRGIRASFQASGINPSYTSLELFRLMQRAGFKAIVCSPESASDKMLLSLKKGFSTEEIHKTVRFIKEARIPSLWTFMFGGPGETEETAGETLEFIERYVGTKEKVLLTCGIRVYPGTELELRAREEGHLMKDEGLLHPTFYLSRTIDPERLLTLISRASDSHPNYISLSDIQIPWVPLANRVISLLKLPSPAWRYASLVNKMRRLFVQAQPARWEKAKGISVRWKPGDAQRPISYLGVPVNPSVSLRGARMRINNTWYNELGDLWWNDKDGPVAALHWMNPARFEYYQGVLGDLAGMRVLDLGSGGGILSEEFAKAGAWVVGLDICEGPLRVARAHALRSGLAIHYVRGRGEELPFRDGAFEAIVCSNTLEHVEDVERVIKEVSRVIGGKGKFLYDTINRTLKSKVLMILVVENLLKAVPKGTHDWRMFIRPGELSESMQRYGIRNVETKGLAPLIKDAAKVIKDILLLGSYRRITYGLGANLSINYIGYGIKEDSYPGRPGAKIRKAP